MKARRDPAAGEGGPSGRLCAGTAHNAVDPLRRERPELAAAFAEFLLRTLADRLMATQRMVTALSG